MRIALALALLLAACAAEPVAEPITTLSPSPPTHVVAVAKLAPLADLVQQVGGERVTVTSLVPDGADSHTFEPRPGDARRLTEADVFFANGLDLNDAVLRLAEANLPADAALVKLAEEIADEDDVVFDHVHDHDHDHGHDHDHDNDAEAGPNPHLWMSVPLAMRYVEAIRNTLITVDPDGAEHYRANAADYLETLEALDAAITEAVATIPEGDRTLVTYHDSWSYFAPQYGLELIAVVQPADLSQPSASEIRRLIDAIDDHGVRAIFGSEVFPSDVLEVIAEETGASYVWDLADDELPGDVGDPEHSYVGMMIRNARAVVTALGGDPAALDRVDPSIG